MPRGPEFQKERGREQRRRILARLANGPMSAQELAGTIHLSRAGILLHIQVLREEQQVRIAGYQAQSRSRPIPLYGPGNLPDAEYVHVKRRQINSFKVHRAMVDKSIIDQLKIARATSTELAALIGVAEVTMRKYLARMRSDNKIYRASWVAREGGGIPVAVWAHGCLLDAPIPADPRPRGMPRLPDEQKEILYKKRLAKDIIRAATQKKNGIFSALGL